MTNGEKIKALFPDMYQVEQSSGDWESWWNAEYQEPTKSLEQEPTIQERQAESDRWQKAFDDGYQNGYSQASFDCRQDLDKIRAEINAIIGEHNLDDYDFCSGLICARKIIDKYKAESEKA